jgi:hypothetical protein
MHVFRSAAFVAIMLGATAAAPQTGSPASVTSALYAWVFHGSGDLHAIRPLLTPRFYADLTEAEAVERRTHKLVLDANPFIDAQIQADSATVGAPALSGATARVPVKIVYKRFPSGNVLTIVAVRTSEGWRIDDILDHTGHSTDAEIRHNLAQARKYEAAHAKGA